jgi:hypothetical protein
LDRPDGEGRGDGGVPLNEHELRTEEILDELWEYDSMYKPQDNSKKPKTRTNKSSWELFEEFREILYYPEPQERASVDFMIRFLLKLEEEFSNYLKSRNSRWITNENREAFKNDLLDKPDYNKLKEALIVMNKQFPLTETLIPMDDDEIAHRLAEEQQISG